MGRARRWSAVAGVLLGAATILTWGATASEAAAPAAARGECALNGGTGICDSMTTSGNYAPGETFTIRGTSDSCGGPADILYFTDGFAEGPDGGNEPVGEGVYIGTTSPPAIFEGAFTIPEDEDGDVGIAMFCQSTGEYTASNGPFSITGTTTTTAAPTTTTEATTTTTTQAPPPPVIVSGHVRPSISASVPSVGDVSTEASLLAANLVIAVLLILVAFPAELFNATFEEHYDEISGWFAGPKRALDRLAGDGTGSPWVPFAAITVVAAFLYMFLDPHWSFDQATFAMVLGVGLSIAAAVLISGAVSRRYVSAHHEDRGRLRIYPGALFVAAACVLVSRLADFQPGYLYGVIAGFVFTAELNREEDGRNAARVGVAGLAVSGACWLLLSPVRDLMDDPKPAFLLVFVEAFLAAMFVGGLQALVFGFLPLRFLPGQKVWRWSRPVWAVLFGIGLFGFLQILLHPESDYEGSMVTMILLFAAFAAISVGFWAFFRGRSEGSLDDVEATTEDADHVEAE